MVNEMLISEYKSENDWENDNDFLYYDQHNLMLDVFYIIL